jgi:TolB-like protein
LRPSITTPTAVSSIVQGFEYDIFISYRHNDNRSGWVSDFVEALKEELAATIKQPLRIYFDKNPEDGLLETHHVDKSLEGKLKCLVFIPILSQTYCDPKGFAWNHEFCAFNKLSANDEFGRDIKLSNGNVASRILPIQIHDLDSADRSLIEKEIGGILRAIEFIYSEPGVNRPLKPNDSKSENQNKTDYRNQINKIANAIKELLQALDTPVSNTASQFRGKLHHIPLKNRRRLLIGSVLALILAMTGFISYYVGGFGKQTTAPERSIAVLPFDNMNKDPEQDYFSSGMTEDILNHLAKIGDLEVKSRTSILQYKGTTKTVSEIGEELGVSNVVEGSVRKVGDKVRIVVQLIDAKRDIHLWSETYDRDLKDILNLQSEIAIEIAEALKAKLTESELSYISKEVTHDITAYDYYLRARDKFVSVKYTKESLLEIMDLLNLAIVKDRNFALAYSIKAEVWFEMIAFGVAPEACVDSAFAYATKATTLDREAPDGYLVMASMNKYIGRFKEYERNLKTAYEISPGNQRVGSMYGYYLLDHGDEAGAELIIKSIGQRYSTRQPEYYDAMVTPYFYIGDHENVISLFEKLKELNPSSTLPLINLGRYYLLNMSDYAKAKSEAQALLKIVPNDPSGLDILAWSEYYQNNYNKAIEIWQKHHEVELSYEDTTQVVPFRHREAMALLKVGRKKEAMAALRKEVAGQNRLLHSNSGLGIWGNRGGTYYALAVCQVLLGNDALAIQNLDSAVKYRFIVKGLYEGDPVFEKIKETPSFLKVQAKVDKFYEFRRKAFMKALNRNQANEELKQLLSK